MKRMALLLIICSYVIGAVGKVVDDYSYLPMIVEGRTWNYVYHKVTENEEDGQVTDEPQPDLVSYTIQGDTVIEGKACKKLYRKVGNKMLYDSSWYEDGRRVYVFNVGSERFTPMLDFSQKEENFFVLELEKSYSVEFASIEEDYILVHNTLRRRCRFMVNYDENIYDENIKETERAVEGIGGKDGLFGIFQPVLACHCDYKEFVSCEEDGEVIFTKDDFNKEAYVEPEPIAGYRPMLKEGKTWNEIVTEYRKVDLGDGIEATEEVEYPVRYVLEGDTVINGRKYMKMYKFCQNEKTYHSAWYEENCKVYCIYENESNEHLIFDFRMTVGEVAAFASDEDFPLLLKDVDLVCVNGNVFYRQHFSLINEEVDDANICVSGVGSKSDGIFYGGFSFQLTSNWNSSTFVSCEEDGEVIFTKDDFNREVYVNGVHKTAVNVSLQKSGKTYDLQGREVTAPQPGRIYIKDGKKFIVK